MSAESIVVGLAFAVSCLVLYSPITKALKKILDAYHGAISLKIESLINDKEEHEKLLRSTLKEYDDLDKEVERILNSAKARALALEKNANNEAQKLFDNKIKAAKEDFLSQTEYAIQDIRRECIEISCAAIKKVTEESFQSDLDQEKILDLMRKEMATFDSTKLPIN